MRYKGGSSPLEHADVKAAIAAATNTLGSKGRVLVRKSGTEALIRIMVEGENETQIRELVEMMALAVSKAAA
jgi:phosphoglucosamine mutase